VHGHFVDIGNVNLYVQDVGEGPALVLLNGGPGNSLHSFHPEFMAASEFARVIFYDRRGEGQSDWKPGAGYSVAQALADLDGLRVTLDLDNWVLAGHSWGGFLALAYAEQYPGHTRGIVLIDALTRMKGPDASDNEYADEFMSDEERRRIRDIYSVGTRIVASHSDALDLASLQEKVFNAYMNGDWRRQYYLKPSIKQMAQIALYDWVHDKNYNLHMAQDTQTYDLTGKFQASQIPILAYEGRRSPVWGTWRSNRIAALNEAFPNGKVVVLERSSHFPFKSEPQKFFRELRDFIEQLPEN
jgi:proline-specific peptidase